MVTNCPRPVSVYCERTRRSHLPQPGVIEQTLDENRLRVSPDLPSGAQATLGAWQEAVRRGRRRDTAAVEIAFRRERDTRTEVRHPPHWNLLGAQRFHRIDA